MRDKTFYTTSDHYKVVIVGNRDETHAEIVVDYPDSGLAYRLGSGKAKRHKKDTFYRGYGEVLALKRALDDASAYIQEQLDRFENSPKEDRKNLWS